MSAATHQWIVRPNRSLTWPQAKRVLLVLAAVPLSGALMLAWLGYWPILAFAGGELGLLGLAFYVFHRGAAFTEVITLDLEGLAVEKGRGCCQTRWSARPAWVRVDLNPSPVTGHPSRLHLRSSGRAVALGECLLEQDRRRLAREIHEALIAAGGLGGDPGAIYAPCSDQRIRRRVVCHHFESWKQPRSEQR